MALSTAEFWELCAESRLLSQDECQDRDAAYRAVPGANAGDAVKLAQWLVAQRALTAYQAKVLLSGRPGPFVYGEYKVDDLISSGRRAGVFRATHLPTGHRVALYALSGAGDKDRARLTLARQKVEVARRAAHPLLLACYEMVEVDRMRFIALEDLAGQSLEEHLAARGSLPVSEACRVGQLSALALSCLHDLGQAHGEMRPANIWFGKSGEVKVLQVPLSRDPLAGLHSLNDSAFDAEQRLSAVADYMAPELTQAGRAPYPAADVYALGCTLYQALSGRAPFAGGDWRQKSARHAMEPVEPLARIGVPVPLSKLIIEMLAKEPPQRPPMLQVAKCLVRHVTTPNPPAAPEPLTLNAYERLLVQRRAGQPAAVLVPPAAVPAAPRQLTPPTAAPTFAVLPANGMLPDVTAAAAARSESFSKQTTPTQPEPKPLRGLSKRAKQQYTMLAGALLFLAFSIVVAAVTVTSRMREPTIVETPPAKPIRRPPPPPSQDRPASEQVGSITGPNGPGVSNTSNAPVRLTASTQPSVLLTGVEEGDDDGRSLWISPTNGAPLKLTDLAFGPQWFLAVRPAQLLEQPGAEKLLMAIGPAATWAREQIEAIAGVPCTAIEQLTVAGYESADATPSLSFVVRLRRTWSLADLQKAWKDPAEYSHNGRAYYQGSQWAYFLPPGENDQLLVIADAPRLKQIIEAEGAAPPLPPRLECLLEYTDQQRLLTIGFFPPALAADNGPLADLPAGLRAQCARFVGQPAKVAIFSAHLDNQLFGELRLRGTTEEPAAMANQLRQRLIALATEYSSLAESGMAAGSAPPSLLFISQMVRIVFDYARTGVEDEQAVARWYLPAEAAPHLAAAIMALQNPSEPLRGDASNAPGSVADKLVRKIDLSFPRETLESALGQLSREIGVPIEILGGDLQLEGITKNQSFVFNERQRPAGEILRKILWQANPDGKLVYVIKSNVPGGRETLFVTTRAAARRRGDTIPPELDQQSK